MRRILAATLALLPLAAFAGSEWELLKHTADVDVYKHQLATDKEPEIKRVGALPAAPKDVLSLITDIKRYASLLSNVKTAEVLKSAPDEAVVYFYFDLPWPLSDIDYVADYRWKKKGDGYLIQWTDANYWRPDLAK